MRFWDASAVLPLLVGESYTTQVQSLLADDPQLLVWWGTRLEVVSALAKAGREGRLPLNQMVIKVNELSEILRSARIVAPGDEVAERAERLLLSHTLRAADALQLAAASVAVHKRSRGVGFVSLDQRLRTAAGREGFTNMP